MERECAIEEAAMKLGYLGFLWEKTRKVILCFLEENDVFVSLFTQIICWIRF